MVHGQYIGFASLLSIYQKWWRCYVNRSCSVQAAKMEGGHNRYWNSIIFRKGAIYRSEIERPFLAANGFNTNLVQFLSPYHVLLVTCTSTLLRARFPTCTDVHVKRFCAHEISCTKNYNSKDGFKDGFRNNFLLVTLWAGIFQNRPGWRLLQFDHTFCQRYSC